MMSGFEVAIAHVAGPKINRMQDGSKGRVNGSKKREIGRRRCTAFYGKCQTTWTANEDNQTRDEEKTNNTTFHRKPNFDHDNIKKKRNVHINKTLNIKH